MRSLLLLLSLFWPLSQLAAAPKPRPKSPSAKTSRAAVPSGCPQNKKEWQAKGPKILLEKAARQPVPVEIPDFTTKLGKKGGATGTTVPFRGIKAEMVMVQVHDEASSLFLSGVLRCDPQKNKPVLVSLTYVKGDKSGLVKVVEE